MIVGLAVALGALTLAISVVGALRYAGLPAKHGELNPRRVNTLVSTLLNQGYGGGTLTFQERNGESFLQMMKYIGTRRSGIQLDFPHARWSEQHYDRARAVLAANNIQFEEESTGRTDTKSFLTVDFGTDVSLATRVVCLLAAHALDIDMEHDMVAYFRNVSRDPTARIGLK